MDDVLITVHIKMWCFLWNLSKLIRQFSVLWQPHLSSSCHYLGQPPVCSAFLDCVILTGLSLLRPTWEEPCHCVHHFHESPANVCGPACSRDENDDFR